MIEFRNIYLKFDNKVLFEDFKLEVKSGQKIILRAPSGKGKTTLVKMLMGFIKPDEGYILFDNKTLGKDTIQYFRKNIAYVSQDVELRQKVVWDLLQEIFQYKNNKHIDFSRDRVLELFEYFELEEDVLENDIDKISGGQRQRLGLIICILLDRKVWILDEVTSGLDNHLKEKVINYIQDIEKTVIVISHDDIWVANDCFEVKEW